MLSSNKIYFTKIKYLAKVCHLDRIVSPEEIGYFAYIAYLDKTSFPKLKSNSTTEEAELVGLLWG